MAPVTVLERARAECPSCRRSVPLRGDGTLARHHNLSASMLQRTGAVCVGSHLPPDAPTVVVVVESEPNRRRDLD